MPKAFAPSCGAVRGKGRRVPRFLDRGIARRPAVAGARRRRIRSEDRGSRCLHARNQRSLHFMRSDWNAARRGSKYDEDPARGTVGPLWRAPMPYNSRSCASNTIITSTVETSSVLAACDKDKQPMALIGTVGTTTMGDILQRRLKVIREDGSCEVRSASLA